MTVFAGFNNGEGWKIHTGYTQENGDIPYLYLTPSSLKGAVISGMERRKMPYRPAPMEVENRV